MMNVDSGHFTKFIETTEYNQSFSVMLDCKVLQKQIENSIKFHFLNSSW